MTPLPRRDPAPISPHELLLEVERERRGLARGSRKALVVADRELLRRLIENVLDHSLEYAPCGSAFQVRLPIDAAAARAAAVPADAAAPEAEARPGRGDQGPSEGPATAALAQAAQV